MARGDYAEVTYKVGDQAVKQKISATRDGGIVEVSAVKSSDPFIMVEEQGRNQNVIRTARFAKSEVIAIVEGHEKIGRQK